MYVDLCPVKTAYMHPLPLKDYLVYEDSPHVLCHTPKPVSPSQSRAGIFKPLWSPGIDAKASIPPAYIAWRAGTITLFLLGA